MTDGRGRNGDGPPTGAVPPESKAARPSAASRHDHFPRSDAARRKQLHQREVALAEQLRAADEAPDGIITQMRALAGTGADADPDTIFAAMRPWLMNDAWIGARMSALAALCRADDFAMPPARIFSGAALAGLILAEAGPITLSLMVRPFNAPAPRAPTVIFSPGHGLTRMVKAPGAKIERYRVTLTAAERAGGFRAAAAAPCISLGRSALTAGQFIQMDQSCESFNLTSGDGDIVMAQLFVRTPTRVPMREYDPATGRLVRVAAAGRATSFRQMGVALLRAFGRRDAVPQFINALSDPDFAMRWQVMRELIALDPAAALPHLTALASGDPHPEVRAAAAATLPLVREHLAQHAPPTVQPATEPA